MNCGDGSNTKAELMALWASLYLASSWLLDHLLILGDSRIIIDWINLKSNLQSVHIEGWKKLTRMLANLFTAASFHHIPRCHNTEADTLSKKALGQEAGKLNVYHNDNGIDSPISTITMFEP
jgi:ribonuclease HI